MVVADILKCLLTSFEVDGGLQCQRLFKNMPMIAILAPKTKNANLVPLLLCCSISNDYLGLYMIF